MRCAVRSVAALVALLPLLSTACRRTPFAPSVPEPIARPHPSDPIRQRDEDSLRLARTPDAARERQSLPIARRRAVLLEPIYFRYDDDLLSDAARLALDAKREVLAQDPSVVVRIAGHCDERGSDEYNIALGRRRALAAKQYLVDRGIDAGRIETTSLGREQPAVAGTSESSWSRNRRDEFHLVRGGATLGLDAGMR